MLQKQKQFIENVKKFRANLREEGTSITFLLYGRKKCENGKG